MLPPPPLHSYSMSVAEEFTVKHPVFSPPFAVNGTIMRRWKCRFKKLKTKDGFFFYIQSVIYAVILNIKNY